ncbi:MAG: SDR family NAD(P)-dependent oxidoreductase [Smithellaceae bacterium]|nr:SDR family NAD(P)-dependent oxidoreductase [Smithellaceae bacterium]
MKILKNKTAAVTGAASGIGRMLAVNLAKEGCSLAISDINGPALQETAKLIGDRVNVTSHIVDVSQREQVFQYADEAVENHGGVDLIINNAGVSVGDFLETIPMEDFEWLMGINFWGVVYGTMAFLPHLKKRPEGHIVNISSINGIIPNPNNGPYCAAKFAVRGYTETLAQEMHGTNIHVSCVHPGGIKTNIARNARVNRAMYELTKETAANLYEEKLFRTTADDAAKIIISGIRCNRRRILVGADAKFLDLLTRFFPVTAVTLSTVFSRRIAQEYASK